MSGLTKKQWITVLVAGAGLAVVGGSFVFLGKPAEPPQEAKRDEKPKKKDAKDEAKKGPRLVSFAGRAFGSTYTVRALPKDAAAGKKLPNEVRELFGRLETELAGEKPESSVAKVNAAKAKEKVELSAEVAEILTRAEEAFTLSGGAVDLTVGPLEKLYADGKTPSAAELASAKKGTGFRSLGFDAKSRTVEKALDSLTLDLAPVAAAYAVDRVVALLEKEGIENYQVTVSQATRVRGEQGPKRPWSLAVSRPDAGGRGGLLGRLQPKEPVALASFLEVVPEKAPPAAPAVSVSSAKPEGTPPRPPARPHFSPDSLVDPRTGEPTKSASLAPKVVASTALEARLLALAARRLSPEAALELANKNQLALVTFTREGDETKALPSEAFGKLPMAKVQPRPEKKLEGAAPKKSDGSSTKPAPAKAPSAHP